MTEPERDPRTEREAPGEESSSAEGAEGDAERATEGGKDAAPGDDPEAEAPATSEPPAGSAAKSPEARASGSSAPAAPEASASGSSAPAAPEASASGSSAPAAPKASEPDPAAAEPAKASDPPAGSTAAEGSTDGGGARPAGEVLITADRLTKYYGSFMAIRDVSFSVHRGEVVAFLGPNGAGKSTAMKILTGVIASDGGRATIAGRPVMEHRTEVAGRIGYLPENGPLYDEMTPESLLRFLGEARGLARDRLLARLDDLRKRLGLGSVWRKAIHKLSKGFRQRVGLAQALVHDPDVLILDEPTAGLDPNQIRGVRRTIRELGRDKAVLLSTHILQEVEAVADRVVFIHEGQIAFQGTVAELKATGADLDEAFATHTGHAAAGREEVSTP